MIRKFFLFCLLIICGSRAFAEQPLNQKTRGNEVEKEHFKAGRSFEEQQQYEKAVHEFQQAIATNPKVSWYYDNLGFCLRKLQRPDDAMGALNTAISLNPRDDYAHRELAIIYCDKRDFSKAIDLLNECVSLNAADADARLWLGYALYRVKKYGDAVAALDEALKLRADDFDGNYWHGLSLFRLDRLEEARESLGKAVKIRPNDFNANLWRGMSLARQRDFKNATLNFEKAHQIKPDDKVAQLELFSSYLATSQTQKAASIYPHLILEISGCLIFVYCVWFAALLPFSLPIRDRAFPGFWFSLAWLGLFLEGQGAFLLFLASLPAPWWHETVLSGAVLSGLPIIIVALTGFARQPWGEPFRWPPRFGSRKHIGAGVVGVCGSLLFANGIALFYTHLTNHPFPVQRTIPLIRTAIQLNPVAAWLGVVFIIPYVEEILFRGLLFGALQKIWGITAAVLVSSVLFVLVHLQLVGFLVLFLVGLILAWARLRSASLGLPIALHALNNAIAMLVLTFVPMPPAN